METVTSRDGTTIAFWRSGHGPPLLLVHGGLSDRTTWNLVRPAFEERFTVYVINRRGREGSGASREHELEREFEDVAAVMDAIGEPVHVVGHSGGALSALGASLLTEQMRSLTLYEPPTPGADRSGLAKEVRELVDAGNPDEAAVAFLRKGPGLSAEEIERLKQSPIWPSIAALASSLPAEVGAISGYEFKASRFAGLACPALLLLGGDSLAPIREVTYALAKVWPNAQVKELAGQRHMANLAAPDLFVSEVLAFLDGV